MIKEYQEITETIKNLEKAKTKLKTLIVKQLNGKQSMTIQEEGKNYTVTLTFKDYAILDKDKLFQKYPETQLDASIEKPVHQEVLNVVGA